MTSTAATSPSSSRRASARRRTWYAAGVSLTTATLVCASSLAATAATSAPSATRNPDGSVTLTVPAEQVERFCTETGPKALERAQGWVERVRGDEGTRGSADWLRAQADRVEDAGRDRLADRLRERAARAEDRVDHVAGRTDRLRERLETFCTDGAGS